MALGYCPALLKHIDEVAEGNSPTRKMHVAGFLATLFCCQNSTVSPINDGNTDDGHTRPLTVKYRQRPTATHVQDEDDCDVNRIPAYAEWTLPTLSHKQTSFFLNDATIQQYCADASVQRSVGAPPTRVMQEHWDLIIEHANILLKEINKDLVADMATSFGLNTTTGYSTGKYINIDRTGGNILDDGIVELLRDLQENEICAEPCFVGGGLWAAWNTAKDTFGLNNAGMDLSNIGLPKFFFDKDTQSIWGENSAALISPGSVKFIGRNAYTGAFAGQKGTSFFTTLPLPVNEFGCNDDSCLQDLVFDLQLKYIDCPTTITVNGQNTTVNRGWQVIISKKYALWVQPTSAYAAGDELAGTNGTLKYFLSNTGYAGGAYGKPY